mmetsp:Transcript_32922/g.115606  ORF Transcript_32922/g.115606 Transcript_32922/m.115606 type:complete len:86 (-) Transcript_32922:33-290(-)
MQSPCQLDCAFFEPGTRTSSSGPDDGLDVSRRARKPCYRLDVEEDRAAGKLTYSNGLCVPGDHGVLQEGCTPAEISGGALPRATP